MIITLITSLLSISPIRILGVIVFSGVVLYAFVTIYITLWRKKFREATNKNDNDLHDKAQDSILNFETVKYFTAEAFEIKRFTDSVIKFQLYSAKTSYSMSILNGIQQVIMLSTLLGSLMIAGKAVTDGDMSLGDWVAVQTWVTTIFIPLNFLGSIYGMIVQALVDVRNLSELLSETADIVDEPDATPLDPYNTITSSQRSRSRSRSDSDVDKRNETELSIVPGGASMKSTPVKKPGISVEFRGVHFNYPEQPVEKGLKDVSFTLEAGSTTAVVGSTGAGKTTISRLLFRFYEPRLGEVCIEGRNIKHHTQNSVRGLIGIVPQDTVLFNDSIM